MRYYFIPGFVVEGETFDGTVEVAPEAYLMEANGEFWGILGVGIAAIFFVMSVLIPILTTLKALKATAEKALEILINGKSNDVRLESKLENIESRLKQLGYQIDKKT